MNVHVAQSLPAIAEESSLMLIDQHIITPQSAKPVLGFVQDCMTSMFELCKPHVRLRLDHAMTLYMRLSYPQQPFVRQTWTTGRQMFSYMLPASFQYCNHGVLIVDGQLIEAVRGMTSKILGTSNGGLIHALARYPRNAKADFDDALRATQEFISDGQRLGLAFFEIRGFSVSIMDMMTTNDTQRKVVAALVDGRDRAVVEAKQVTKYVRQHSQKELNILARLDKATSDAGALAQKELKPENNVRIMLESGSKGKPSNVMQMSACLGQQIISGYRPQLGFELSNRSLPHFTVEESHRLPEARGFIKSSFVKGLSAREHFSGAQGGREGMTDTAVKSVTAETLIIVRINGAAQIVSIGQWIDEILSRALQTRPNDIEKRPAELNTEILDVSNATIEIPTVDKHGHVFWTALTAVTRHESDGTLYKVSVLSFDGRIIDVTVPASKSLLVWSAKKNQFLPLLTPDVCVGDSVPVAHEKTLHFGVHGKTLVDRGILTHRDRQNDVFLKRIVHIEKLYCPPTTKLYDVTVPATYNFVLANGLGVRDTRESGYFTRKLVKFFENATIAYDGSVRINGPQSQIVQYAYGDDGIDPMFLELQKVVLYRPTPIHLCFLGMRHEKWIQTLWAASQTLQAHFPVRGNDRFYVAVNGKQLLAYCQQHAGPVDHSIDDSNVDLDAWHDKVVYAIRHADTLQKAHFLSILAPGNLCRLKTEQWRWMLDKVMYHWEMSRAVPGEKVGIIAAQSFGQLAVQATLVSQFLLRFQ